MTDRQDRQTTQIQPIATWPPYGVGHKPLQSQPSQWNPFASAASASVYKTKPTKTKLVFMTIVIN